MYDLQNDPDEMNNLIDDPGHQDIAERLKAKILTGWNPEKINETITGRKPGKAILKAWAENVKPADSYKYETRAEDNWLA